MRILIVLTYYRPHISGLTIYAERLARAFSNNGHEVTILTSRYDSDLPADESVDGVRIVRAPVLFRLSKGVVMPTFGWIAQKLIAQHDVVQIHLPQLESSIVSILGRLFHKPTLITYHCDLIMPPGGLNWLANQAVNAMNHLAALFTDRIVTYTQDYAENSQFLVRYLKKVDTILPPVELPIIPEEKIEIFKKLHNPNNQRPVIGMAARFATEKGVEILLEALADVIKVYPEAQVQFAGPTQEIMGEEKYFRRLIPRISKFEKSGNWRFVGTLTPEEMAAYYPNLDVLVLPSLNSTEAFGLVQIEAMMSGVPVIASNLPGVRQPVKMHEMGEIVPIGDSKALSDALIAILRSPENYKKDTQSIKMMYLKESIADAYQLLFLRIAISGRNKNN
jgi:glycosyltransferase involved in cell wall biosynthesis